MPIIGYQSTSPNACTIFTSNALSGTEILPKSYDMKRAYVMLQNISTQRVSIGIGHIPDLSTDFNYMLAAYDPALSPCYDFLELLPMSQHQIYATASSSSAKIAIIEIGDFA